MGNQAVYDSEGRRLDTSGLDNEAPNLKNYRVRFTAIIKGSVYIAARSKAEAVDLFLSEEPKEFDTMDEFGKCKVNSVEEIET